MIRLLEIAAVVGLPVSAAGCVLDLVEAGPIFGIAPFPGQVAAVSKALGVAFPAPGRSSGPMIWAGREMAFYRGPFPEGLDGLAAVTEQSDGWAVLSLQGVQGPAVLARLVPVDLREGALPVGYAARSLLGQMPALFFRPGADVLEVFVMRSMVGTAVQEIAQTMRAVAARG